MRARESYLSLLETNLRANHDQFAKVAADGEKLNLSALDIQKIAVDEEYKIFSANKVITTYRRGMAFLMAAVKKETDAWTLHPAIAGYDPEKNHDESLPAGDPDHEDHENDESRTPSKSSESSDREGGGDVFQTGLYISRKEAEQKQVCMTMILVTKAITHFYSIFLSGISVAIAVAIA